MSYNISTIPVFDKQVKRLAKKYPSLKKDLAILIGSLMEDPTQGNALGGNFYKIRMGITSKGKGKSAGARVITYVKIVQFSVYLTFIYDKSERADISFKEIEQLFKLIP